MLQKTHKAARKALKNGIMISYKFNNRKSNTLIIIARDSKTGKLLNSWGRESKYQTDKQLAKAIKTMVKAIKNRKPLQRDFDAEIIAKGIIAAILFEAAGKAFLQHFSNRKPNL